MEDKNEKRLEELEASPTDKNLRERVGLLIKLTGDKSTDTGIDHGHYVDGDLSKIPEEKLGTMYYDLSQMYKEVQELGVSD